MISTLIRSSNIVGGGVPKGNSEYLVDTESNRVIYPYTLIDNIIGRDENGNIIPPSSSDGSGNIIIGGGSGSYSGPGVYLMEIKSIAGIKLPASTSSPNNFASFGPYTVENLIPGVYKLDIYIHVESYTSKPNGTGRYKVVQINDNINNNKMIWRAFCSESNTGYLADTCSMSYFVQEEGIMQFTIKLFNSIDSTARTTAASSEVRYEILRIADLP